MLDPERVRLEDRVARVTGAAAGIGAAVARAFARFVTGTTLHVDGGTSAAGGRRRDRSGGFRL